MISKTKAEKIGIMIWKMKILDYFTFSSDPSGETLVKIAKQAKKLNQLKWLKTDIAQKIDWDKIIN